MARSVADVAAMYEAMSLEPLGHDLAAGIRGLRIGCLPENERYGIDVAQLEAYDRALNVLEELGAQVDPFEPPKPFEEMKVATFVIVTAEGYFHHRDIMENPEARVDENVRARFLPGASISSTEYVGAVLERDIDRKNFYLALEGFDALVTPTTPMLPLTLDEADEDSTPARFTRAINYLSMCASSIPSGISNEGLPTSLQIACRGFNENLCLQISTAYEAARGALPNPSLCA
jgi:aspartyl-tRNA(Asn)/glutamyl-tRNA(Gln) amidotransferase subunit A